MRWPLPEHQRSQLDEEVQEMMELDIFKER